MTDETLSAVTPRRGRAARAPFLYLGVRCDAPMAPPRRFALAGLEAVRIGRGDRLGSERTGDVLAVRVPDPRMSAIHARLTRLGATWVLEDLGSKNGVFVGGAAVTRAVLDVGAVIELGQTSFVFDDDEPADDGDAAEPAPGLATLIPAFAADLARLARAATSTVPVLLHGESGTGKELAARALHRASGRGGRLVTINCGAVPATLIEAELFGHKKGAFSGAGDDRVGLVRSSDGGTLFLDEIAELPLQAQAALLRVLQEREVTPLGTDRPVPVDLRVVAATHQDLEALVADGRFREDLLARLGGVEVDLPPLRERRADLALIVGALLRELDAPPTIRLTVEAARSMYTHPWPRNIRELQRALAAALATRTGDELEISLTAVAPVAGPELSDADRALRDRLADAIARHGGNLAAVSRELGKDRTQIRRWMRRLGLER